MNGEGKTFGSFSEVVQYICEKGREERKIKAMERLADAMEQQLKQVAPETQHPQGITDILPKEALTIIERAIEKEMIEKTATGYKWNRTKVLLAYFAERMSNKYNLCKTTFVDTNTRELKKGVSWKPFETLFNETGLKMAKQNWQRVETSFYPTGHEEVDLLFD